MHLHEHLVGAAPRWFVVAEMRSSVLPPLPQNGWSSTSSTSPDGDLDLDQALREGGRARREDVDDGELGHLRRRRARPQASTPQSGRGRRQGRAVALGVVPCSRLHSSSSRHGLVVVQRRSRSRCSGAGPPSRCWLLLLRSLGNALGSLELALAWSRVAWSSCRSAACLALASRLELQPGARARVKLASSSRRSPA